MESFPNLSALTLNTIKMMPGERRGFEKRCQPTEHFATLTRAQVAQREQDNRVDFITLKPLLPGMHVDEENPTYFLDGQYYDARALYNWLSASCNPSHQNPITRQCVSPLEWATLHARFSPSQQTMPNGSIFYYEGTPLNNRRKVRAENGEYTIYFTGRPAQERMVKIVRHADGAEEYFTGGRSRERLVSTVFTNGHQYFFEGERDQEALVRKRRPENNTTEYYEGGRGEEKLVRAVADDGTTWIYEGPRRQERIVQKYTPDGGAYYYSEKGPVCVFQGREQERGNGVVYYYDQTTGALVEKHFQDGTIEYYEGLKGSERNVRTVKCDETLRNTCYERETRSMKRMREATDAVEGR